MSGDLAPRLQQAAASTFEQLGFLFADPSLTEDQADLTTEAVARVRFSGPYEGTLEVRLAGGLLPVLATNMLGTHGTPEPDVAMDALGEVSNVICGNVLPLLAGAEAIFDLQAPEVTGGAEGAPPPLPEAAVEVSLGLEGGRADIALVYDEKGTA